MEKDSLSLSQDKPGVLSTKEKGVIMREILLLGNKIEKYQCNTEILES